MYAVVDIETTGGYASANGITEICIHLFDGEKVVDTFQSLVNPCQPIPRYIQAMTGITDEMVEAAPKFEEVAEEVYSFLKDRVFVAHNVNFDHSFIKAHLQAAGYDLQVKKLCTVRLSRKIIPGHASYSLGKLCDALEIRITGRHRAGGDATATAILFGMLMQKDKEFILKSLGRNSKENVLPPNVPKEHFDQLPYTPGVYYFHNEKGKIIYVGKAKNIRYRVNSHFSNNSASRQRQNFLKHTYAISFKSCGTELMAQILESTEIKKLWPMFNYSQKSAENMYGIFMYEDRNGYHRLAIERNKKQLRPVYTFHYLTEGHAILRKLIKDHQLCPKLCFIQTSGECEGMREHYCHGACEHAEDALAYNARVSSAIGSLSGIQASYMIIDQGLGSSEKSCILVWDGKFYGMGYLPTDITVMNAESLKDLITPYKENLFIRNLVASYAERYPDKVKYFEV
ncbi:GIY-YIG nuclease family protein [Terrimonas sp. NA20]|uniref:GIY-YIG nuclease family protein n=1 Tax=Terrimonas ginsenosidimutans TaxID=2908004 RepID=A0ABS9KRS6_9BACT|nr:exonuclease domain-containing protein [Terrimonas ginsenosidimutans]MCG2615009.1 GIY-YIG nuclease family protein [Terrimonas ginsenosidimutans]